MKHHANFGLAMADHFALVNAIDLEGCKTVAEDGDYVVHAIHTLRSRNPRSAQYPTYKIVAETGDAIWNEMLHDGAGKFLGFKAIPSAKTCIEALEAIGVANQAISA